MAMSVREKAKKRLARLRAATKAGTFPTKRKKAAAKPKPKKKTRVEISANDMKQVRARQRAERDIPEGNVRRGGK